MLLLVGLKVILRGLQPWKSYTIEKYKDMGSDLPIAYNISNAINAIIAIMEIHEKDAKSLNLMITYQLKQEIEKNN